MYNYFIKRLKKKNRGFTLIEVIVVIGILAILSALAIPAVGGYLNSSKEGTNQANAKIIYNAANAYTASTPTATAADLALITPTTLQSNNYLATEPKTAGKKGSFVITYTSTTNKFSIAWPVDTGRTGELLTYPN